MTIKTFDLKIKVFQDYEQKLSQLNEQKTSITPKVYKQKRKEISKECSKRLKQIDKQYPIKKEIEKFLNEE